MEKDQTKVISLLAGMGVFRGVSRHRIELLAEDFELSYLAAEERLLIKAGQNDNFYIVFSGSVEVSRKQNKREIDVEALITGDHFGEFVLLGTREYSVSVIALEDTLLLRLDRQTFNQLLNDHPDIRKFLLAAIASRCLVYARRFTWLSKGEHIYLILRKHWTYLLVTLVGPTLAAWAGLAMTFFSFDIQTETLRLVVEWMGILLFILAAGWAVWVWVDWANDYYLVTDQRAIWLEKIVGLYENRQEAPLSMVLTVGVYRSQLGRILGYGDVVVRTFTGQIVMRDVGMAEQLAGVIEEQLRRQKEIVQRVETEALESAIRQRLGFGGERTPKPQPPAASLPRTPDSVRLSYQTNTWRMLTTNMFKVRIEEEGAVIYRKHWILLAKRIWKPSAALIFVLVVLAMSLPTLFATFSVPLVFSLSLLTVIILAGWGFYEYVDWINDIYILTPDQIMDIYRTPLGREDKKTAPLENILSLEHQQIGILGVLLNYGNVIAMVGSASFVFQGVYNPASVRQEIFERMGVRKTVLKQQESARERERIADWMAAYHRQVERWRRDENLSNLDQN
jgi:Cyclic nucleotide-binding domain